MNTSIRWTGALLLPQSSDSVLAVRIDSHQPGAREHR
jgi:hypothetical protein